MSERVFEGTPIKTPQLVIVTIGAGGGRIVWMDREGRLRVGPESAGGYPGPICYGRGGTDVTVTDAKLVLGRLGTGSIAGGSMQLDRASGCWELRSWPNAWEWRTLSRSPEGIIR